MNRGCKYRYIKCPLLCKPSQIHRMKYTAKDLLKHFQNECEEFIEICNNCNTSMKRKQMLNHVCENDCTKLYSHKQKDYSKFEFQQSIEMEETCLTEDTQESITPNQNQIITQNIKQLDKAAINYLNYKY
ncbi:hypothetical protein OXYTRIMIC_593 [Oxytricha trifallax]|uniref:TRAF-type domain-containing protein n=1 Tax=Oxytricha trifallax TaxID=1172189 RepID=A0A073IAR7_9SPIT|nr:hypothetical protein OXYTRIMIC_593 [Oxytricha trifallax]